ncbi:Outer membrane protein assembly factor YaeT precursor [Minicystis rosea]|nr:Outer membrane protein assembly factor YaeT precursor [Minicystis rosea]
MSFAGRTIAILALLALGSFGCASIPKGMAAVDDVRVQGNDAISGGDIEGKVATAESPKFFGLFRGLVYDYQLYDRSVLQRDLERVERYYRARGYYEAKVRAGRVRYKGEKHVEVTIEVEEGKPVVVEAVQIEGLDGLAAPDAELVRRSIGRSLKRHRSFEEEAFLEAERSMTRALTDLGHAWAKVERRADVDLPKHQARLIFVVKAGPKAKFGAIRIEGRGELPEAPIRRALDIVPGTPYSTRVTASAQQAVLDLGTFSVVEIVPVLPDPPPEDGSVPLVVKLRPQKLKSILAGGGLQLDAVRTQIHGRVGWEHKNLFGGFRHFQVDLKAGFDLYPTRIPTFQKPTALLPEERLRVELREPGFLEARTNGVIRSELNTYPVLLSANVDPKAPVLGYLEYKGSLGLDRTWKKLLVAPSYNIQLNEPFTYKGARDPDLRGLAISYLDLLAQLDFRDDKLRPHAGALVQTDLQFAGLGGAARDFRIQPEVRGYVPIGKKVTVAARATVGFLFPMSYGAAAAAARGNDAGATDRAAWIRDIELIYLRGFFSGGASSNRGYPLRGVGPHGSVPFFNPGLQAQALAAACDAQNPSYDPVRCAVPLGGLSLWEASLEVRFPIYGPLGGTTFCDAGDVSPERANLRFDHPHLSCGIGLRYDTPIGPVRLDVGYRIPGAQLPRGTDPRQDGDPGTLYGVPIAFAFGIGEAF